MGLGEKSALLDRLARNDCIEEEQETTRTGRLTVIHLTDKGKKLTKTAEAA